MNLLKLTNIFDDRAKVSVFIQTGGQSDIRNFEVYKKLCHDGIMILIL